MLLGLDVPTTETTDSQNILPAMLGQRPQGNEFIIEDSAELGLRQGNWKFIAPRRQLEWRPVVPTARYNLDG